MMLKPVSIVTWAFFARIYRFLIIYRHRYILTETAVLSILNISVPIKI